MNGLIFTFVDPTFKHFLDVVEDKVLFMQSAWEKSLLILLIWLFLSLFCCTCWWRIMCLVLNSLLSSLTQMWHVYNRTRMLGSLWRSTMHSLDPCSIWGLPGFVFCARSICTYFDMSWSVIWTEFFYWVMYNDCILCLTIFAIASLSLSHLDILNHKFYVMCH